MTIPKRHRQKGGANQVFGKDVNSIASFLPPQIDGLVLWIRADMQNIRLMEIKEYALTQPPTIQDAILTKFKGRLFEKVITEIVSETPQQNSLVRLEIGEPTAFPEFNENPLALDTIDVSNYYDPIIEESRRFTLVTKNPLSLAPMFSSYTISNGVEFSYLDTLGQILVKAPYVEAPTTTQKQLAGLDQMASFVVPTAEFSELIVYNRSLTQEEHQRVEGYLAYKQNEQYKLPVESPYIPEETPAEFAARLQRLEEGFAVDTERLTDELRGKITAAKDELALFKRVLSKASLLSLALKSGTPEQILESQKWFDSKLNPHSVDGLFQKFSQLQLELHSAILEQKQTALIKQFGGAPQTQDAKTEDFQQMTIQETKAKDFYKQLRETYQKVAAIGKASLKPLYDTLKRDMETICEAYFHKLNSLEESAKELDTRFKEFAPMLNSTEWLGSLSEFMDTATTTPGQFREPTLTRLHAFLVYTRDQLEKGDYFFLSNKLNQFEKLFRALLKRADKKQLQPIFAEFYKQYLKQEQHRLQPLFEHCERLLKEMLGYMRQVEKFLATAKETKQAIPLEGDPVTSVSNYTTQITDIYIRRLNSMDSLLTGVEYVLTEADGTPISSGELNEEKKGIQPFFPALLPNVIFDAEKNIFKNDEQTYRILDPLPDIVSILDTISTYQRPPIHKLAIDKLTELPRFQTNAIHMISQNTPTQGIILPETAIRSSDYYIISNTSAFPLCVKIPGIVNPLMTVLGPNEVALYIYKNASEETGIFYTYMPWEDDTLPYDTLLDTPRTELTGFILELGKTIYIREVEEKVYAAVCDREGYLIEAIKHIDGFIYDIDDVFHSRPYSVRSVGNLSLATLLPPRGSKFQRSLSPNRTGNDIVIHIDDLTRLALICRVASQPVVNPFGYVRIAQTPILSIHNASKLRGAYGDLNVACQPSSLNQPFEYEPFLYYDLVFRSRFVRPKSSTYVFTSNAGFPIVAPNGALVEAINAKEINQVEVQYGDIELLTAYKSTSEPVAPERPSAVYDRYDTQRMIRDRRLRLDVQEIVGHYDTALKYIENFIERLRYNKKEFAGLGAEQSKKILETLDDSIKSLNEKIDAFKAYEPIIKEFRGASGAPNEEVKIAADILNIKFRGFLEDCYEIDVTTAERIKIYRSALDQIDTVARLLAVYKGPGINVIHTNMEKISTAIREEQTRRGTTSAADLEELLKRAIKQKDIAEAALSEADQTAAKRPDSIADVDVWYTETRAKFDHFEAAGQVLQSIVDFELANIIQTYTESETLEMRKEIVVLNTELDNLQYIIKSVALWLGVYDTEEQKSYNNSSPILVKSGDIASVTKGLTIPLPMFERLRNPSLEKEIQAFSKTGLSTRFQSEIIEPLNPVRLILEEILKKKIGFIQHKNTGLLEAQLKDMDKESLKTLLDKYKQATGDLKMGIQTYEAKLRPVLEKYGAVYVELGNLDKANIKHSIDKLQSDLKSVQSKILATDTGVKALETYATEEDIKKIKDASITIDETFLSEVSEALEGVNQLNQTASPSQMMVEMNKNIVNSLQQKLDDIHTKADSYALTYRSLESTVIETYKIRVGAAKAELEAKLSAKPAPTELYSELASIRSAPISESLSDLIGLDRRIQAIALKLV